LGGADKKLKEDALFREESNEEKEKPKQIKGKKSFLIIYALTLLAVAFVLVLFSYFNEIRANQTEIADLKKEKETFSISAMQNIQNLQDENVSLSEQVENLTNENIGLQERIADLERKVTELEALYIETKDNLKLTESEKKVLEDRQSAIEKMMWISELYSGKKYSYSAYEISELEAGNGNYIDELFSGADTGEMISKLISRYFEIREWLDKKGYMDSEKIEQWKAKNILNETGN